MKFYGIDMQGKMLIEEANIVPATSEHDRRFVRDTDGRLYIGNTTVGHYVEIITDFDYSTVGGLPVNIKQSFDTTYHPLGGSDTATIKALSFDPITGQNTVKTIGDWFYAAVGDPVDNAGGAGGKRWAGLLVEVLPSGNQTDDAAVYYDGTAGADPSVTVQGWEWRLSGPNYSSGIGATQQIIATREWVNGNYLTGTGSGVSGGDLANYYTKSQIDASWIYSSALKTTHPTLLNADNWLQKICYHETSAPAWATLTATTANTFNMVVRRNGIGDIYATTGHLTATAALYADLAEKYTCDESLPVGTVVAVAVEGFSEYEVVPYDFDNAFNVVGVVSENPAHLMNAEGAGLPIALTGRVPVRVVGEVRKGDFIIASAVNKGCAIKGSYENTFAHKIGIALETNLQDGEKLVECIIK